MANESSIILDISGPALPINQVSNWKTVLPLFVWEEQNKRETLRWTHPEMDVKADTIGFWMIEFAAVYEGDKLVHVISNPNLQCTDVDNARENAEMTSEYYPNLDSVENVPISEIQENLRSIVNPNTVIFHKGGIWEADIGRLCGAQVIDVMFIGVFDIPKQYELNGFSCDVHKTVDLQFCSAAKVLYYEDEIKRYCRENKETVTDLSKKFKSDVFKDFMKKYQENRDRVKTKIGVR